MAVIVGPPPIHTPITDYSWKRWLQRLQESLGGGSGAGTFNGLDFTNSNITSIVSRAHNNLQSFNGGSSGEYYHLTEDHHGGLTAVTSITNSDSPYSALDTNGTILCDATSGAITVNLPAISSVDTGRIYTIKKMDAAANNITIDGNASETIDGATTQTLTTQYERIQIQNSGSEWVIIN